MKQRSRRQRKKLRVGEFRPTALEGAAESALHAAAWAGDIETANSLVANGADANFVDTAGETPLHGASACGNIEMVKFLISKGARVNIHAAATRGFTPLHWAAGWGNLETVRILVESGAEIVAKDVHGLTAEEIAIEHGRESVAQYLRRDA